MLLSPRNPGTVHLSCPAVSLRLLSLNTSTVFPFLT
jgi:hypothetical protein